jgi:UDP-N-acetylglucosamine/UDP-N-acetylgalactosamine diphosphorylase
MASAVKDIFDKLHVTSKSEDAPPREPTSQELDELKAKYEKASQGQVFAFLEDLKSTEKAQLFHQLSTFDPDRINELAQTALNPPKKEAAAAEEKTRLDTLPESATASILDSDEKDIQKWYDTGLELVANNKVAVVLMAGGQGTRLGSSAPKGCFDIGLPSSKSLFQIQAERISKVQTLAQKASGKEKVVVPWYVMTSGPTRKPTEEFFQKNGYFGLEKENVTIFEQGVLPCISNGGKILMESKSKVWIPPPFFLVFL